MKTIFILTLSLFLSIAVKAQTEFGAKDFSSLPAVYLKKSLTVHFISPNYIKYADISGKSITGDIPIKNVLRIKLSDSAQGTVSHAVLTIADEKMITQFRLIYDEDIEDRFIKTNIELSPDLGRPLDFPAPGLSSAELREIAFDVVKRKFSHSVASASGFGLRARLNSIQTLADYIFLDLGFLNSTNLRFDIDELKFSLEDKKIASATTSQSLEIKPEFSLFKVEGFDHSYRNIFVFKKFSFPGNKVFQIRLSEKQVSGRVIKLSVKYRDLLNADIIRR